MLKNYIRIAWRSLLKNRKSSFINIIGLALGMAVFILIGLWVKDELSYDKYHKHHDRIGLVVQRSTRNGSKSSTVAIPQPLGEELKSTYVDNFDYVVMASWEGLHILSNKTKNLSNGGIYMDADGPKMLTLNVLLGTIDGLEDPKGIMLSKSTAEAFFGDTNPINQVMKIDQKLDVKVTAVYEDLPYNTSFKNVKFIAPWALYVTSESWIQQEAQNWNDNSYQLFAQIKSGTSFETVNKNIALAKQSKVSEEDKKFNTQILLHPMTDWHLRNNWKEGKVVGGLIEYVKLFALIGVFVLLLACINFMNLSTARSEKRAKEVGIRKTMGSAKMQLIFQFLSESVLIAFIAFFLSIVLILVSLPWFNEVANKQISILWTNGWFWGMGLLFTFFTGLISGSYPAFYLSSFNPLRVLKGTFRVGRFASLPRKVLVVIQFSISVALIIGTITVFRQIQYTKDRPVGYNRDRLMMVNMATPDFYGKSDLLRIKLKGNGSIEELTESSSPMTSIWNGRNAVEWPEKDPDMAVDFAVIWTSPEYGKTIDWKISAGRDFSRNFATDSAAIILNEAAVKYMGIQNPVGTEMKLERRNYHVIGVVKDVLMSSPFEPVRQTIYTISNTESKHWITLKLNPNKRTRECIQQIESVFKEIIPNAPFEYKFVSDEYAAKFAQEEQIGKLASFFATLAILISCLGVFGLASFVAEQRTKEIGIRKIVGASVFQLWRLLSKDFVLLVIIACLLAIPVSCYFLHEWLQKYPYRSEISWWIFAVTALGAIMITIIIVSFQTIKAAATNPVDSLRDE